MLRDIRLLFSYPLAFWTPFVSITVTVAGFAYMAHLVDPHASLQASGPKVGYFTYVIINLAFMLLLTTALQAAAGALRRDQLAGTLEAMFATGTHGALVVMASAAWPMVFCIMQVSFYFLAATAFGLRLHDVDSGHLALFALLSLLDMALLGVLGAAVVVRFKQAAPSTLLVGSAAVLLTGVLFPVRLLPVPLQLVSWLLPMTHALNGFRAAMLGAPFATVSGDALWLAIAALILAPVSLTFFVVSLEKAKYDGTLAAY